MQRWRGAETPELPTVAPAGHVAAHPQRRSDRAHWRLGDAVKGAKLKVYKGGPHGICTTRKDEVNEDLLAFIRA